MQRLTPVPFLVLSSSSSDALTVYVDPSNCVHLRCEWRGRGEHCKPATRLTHADEWSLTGMTFSFLDEEESDASLLARVKAEYPANTFTIVKDGSVGEHCEERLLWCNVRTSYFEDLEYHARFDALLKRLQNVDTLPRPNFQC